MGMAPYDYYIMTWSEYHLKCVGFNRAREIDQYLLRRVAYIVHASMVSKPVDPEKLWPIGEKKSEVSSSLMKKLAAFKLKQLQDGGTTGDKGNGGDVGSHQADH
jgi:hypothetical protein